MPAPEALLYEYCVIRYVPCLEREEFINIGMVMMCKRQKWLKGKIEINDRRLKSLDAITDINILRQRASMFENTRLPFPDLPVEERYRWLSAVKSAIFQTSPSHPGIIIPQDNYVDNPLALLDEEFNRLFNLMVR